MRSWLLPPEGSTPHNNGLLFSAEDIDEALSGARTGMHRLLMDADLENKPDIAAGELS